MTSALENLIKRIPPPAEPVFGSRADDWLEVENKLGLTLPSEYKNVIELYGDYYWANFLHLLNPFSNNKYLNLFAQIEMVINAETQSREKFPEYYPLPFYPSTNGLLPFFITDNGDVGFWITYLQPDKWSMLLKGARSPEFEVHFSGVARFLLQFTGSNFRSLVLPSVV